MLYQVNCSNCGCLKGNNFSIEKFCQILWKPQNLLTTVWTLDETTRTSSFIQTSKDKLINNNMLFDSLTRVIFKLLIFWHQGAFKFFQSHKLPKHFLFRKIQNMKLCHSKGDNLQDIVHDYILVLNYKIARVCKLIDSIHFPIWYLWRKASLKNIWKWRI